MAAKNEINESMNKTTSMGISLHNNGHHSSSGIALTGERFMDSLILLCCEDSLRMYSTKNVIQVALLPLLFYFQHHCTLFAS